MDLKVIAYARNGHTDKFGIPRQSRDESPIVTRIVFEPEYNVREALRGIEGYSHLWILWGFSEVAPLTASAIRSQDEPAVGLSWSPTVRPPRLGGNKRVGVFATRSPFRPNPIGLSSVRLLGVKENEITRSRDHVTTTARKAIELLVSGADVLDGTPIYDIKPYLSFSDSHPDARNGFAEETKDYRLEVDWSAAEACASSETDAKSRANNALITRLSPANNALFGAELENAKRDLTYILSQDPRPAYQNDPEREYKIDYGGWRVTFCVAERTKEDDERTKEGVVVVKKIEKI